MNLLKRQQRKLKDTWRQTRKSRIVFFIFMILTLSMMGLIFSMSQQSVGESSGLSTKISRLIAPVIYNGKIITEEMMNAVNILVRKTAHMSEYFILFMLSYLTIMFYRKAYGRSQNESTCIKIDGTEKTNLKKRFVPDKFIVYAFIFTVFYAATDETHQIFSGRGASVYDVIIDSAGALIGIIFVVMILQITGNRKLSRRLVCFILGLVAAISIYLLIFEIFYPQVLTTIL